MDSIRSEHQTAADDVDGYLSNPVNAYRLIKRLHNDWSAIEDIVREDHTQMGKHVLYARKLSYN